MKHCVTWGVLLCHHSEPYEITHTTCQLSSAACDKQLLETANICECQEWEKYVALILDEMHIKEDLVFVMISFCALHSGTIFSCFIGPLVGFINLGETNDHLLNLEHSLEEEGSSTINKFHDCVYGLWPLHQTSVPLRTVFLCISVSRSTLMTPFGRLFAGLKDWVSQCWLPLLMVLHQIASQSNFMALAIRCTYMQGDEST